MFHSIHLMVSGICDWDTYLGVAGFPLLPAFSDPPILSIHVPQLNSLPPYTNPQSQRTPISLLKPGWETVTRGHSGSQIMFSFCFAHLSSTAYKLFCYNSIWDSGLGCWRAVLDQSGCRFKSIWCSGCFNSNQQVWKVPCTLQCSVAQTAYCTNKLRSFYISENSRAEP